MWSVPGEFIPGLECPICGPWVIGIECCLDFAGGFSGSSEPVLIFASVDGSGETMGLGAVVCRGAPEGAALVDQLQGVRAEPVWSFRVGLGLVWGCMVSKSDVEVVTVSDGAPLRWFDWEGFSAAEVTPVGFW